MTDPLDLDAVSLAKLIAKGSVSARDVVAGALDRAVDQAHLGSTTTLLRETAIAQAEHATGPFAGVPTLLKDAGQELSNTPMWMGTRGLRATRNVSEITTPLVEQLQRLGFVIIGKAAVPELMTGITTEPVGFEPTRNPWNPSWTAGGSSGGSAAAVASGIVPVAHGSDSTGSLRFPASLCGLFTLKPSRGRVSRAMPARVRDRLHVHSDFVLSRSVADLRAILDAVAEPAPAVRPVERVGVLARAPFGIQVAPVVTAAMHEVAEALRSSGIDVVEVAPDFLEAFGLGLAEALPPITDLHRAEVVTWIEQRIGRSATVDDVSPSMLEAADRGRRVDPEVVQTALDRLEAGAADASRWRADVDALLLPIMEVEPWSVGTPSPDIPLGGLLCSLASFTGQPAAAIPTFQGDIPIGVQLVGGHGTDERLLDVVSVVRESVGLAQQDWAQ